MTIPYWPDELPQQTMTNALQTSARGNRLVTSTDTGPGKQRRRGPALRPVSCSILVDANDRALFDCFFEDTVDFGVTPFLLPDQHLHGLVLQTEDGTPLLDDDGAPILIDSWWLSQFGQKQPATNAVSSFHYSIQFEIVVLP